MNEREVIKMLVEALEEIKDASIFDSAAICDKALAAAARALPEPHPLNERKTQSVIERGYKITGYTLTNDAGQKCIVDMSAVRWFDNGADFFRMMHPDAHALLECQGKPVALPFAIMPDELAALRRFDECVMDDQGYDVPKAMMKRLAEIGLLRRCSGDYYEHTIFGLSVLNGDFDTAPQPIPADVVLDAWQPIETAPKTGKTILLGYTNALGNWRTLRGQWFSQERINEDWEDPEDCEAGWYETSVEADDIPSCWATEPTHWMPLPTPPAIDAAIKGG